MRKLLLSLALSALATGALLKSLEKHLYIKGLSLSPSSLKVDTLSIKAGDDGITVGGLYCNFKKKTCHISSIAVSVPPPVVKKAKPLPPFPIGEISKYLNLTAKVLDRFDWKLNVGTLFFYQKPISVDVYRIQLAKGMFLLGTVEVFNELNENFEGSFVLQNHGKSELSVKVNFSVPHVGFRGNATASWNGQFITLWANGFTPSKDRLILEGKVFPLNRTLKGFVFYSIPKKEIDGKLSATFDGFVLKAEGLVKGKSFLLSYRVDYPLYNAPIVFYSGNATFGCIGNLTFGGDIYNNLLRIGFTSSKNLYGAASISLSSRGAELWGFLTQEGKGFTTFEGVFKKGKPSVGVVFQNATFDICSVLIKGLRGKVRYRKNILKDDLTFEGIDYGNGTIKVGHTGVRLLYEVKKQQGVLLLKGDIRGVLYARKGIINIPAVGGRLFVKRKPIEFSFQNIFAALPQSEIKNSTDGKIRFTGLVRKLVFDNTTVKGVAIGGVYKPVKKALHLKFENNWRGTLSVHLNKPFHYNVELSGDIYPEGKKPLSFYVEAKGSLERGEAKGRLHLPFVLNIGNGIAPTVAFKASYENKQSFKKAKFTLAVSNIANATGKVALKGEKLPSLKGTIAVNFSYGKLELSPRFEIHGSPAEREIFIHFLPFGLNYDGLELLKFKHFDLAYINGSLDIRAETFKGYPLILNFSGAINTRTLKVENLNGTLGIKTDFIDLYTVPYYTAFPTGRYITADFSYSGALKNLPYGIDLYLNEVLPIWTAYTYKPLELFLNLFNENGTYNLFLGAQDNATGEVYATAHAALNIRTRGVKVSWNLGDFPLRAFYDGVLHSYLKVGSNGILRMKPSKRGLNINLNTTLSVEGYIKVDSYKFPERGNTEGENNNSTSEVNYNVSVNTPTGLYVQTPNGEFLVYIKGNASSNGTKTFEVSIAYGKLNLFGKIFYISGGSITINGEKIYVDLPLTLYAPERTIYIHFYGYLPWQNLKMDIYSVPPADKEELLIAILSGSSSGGVGGATQLPIAQEILTKAAAIGVVNLLNRISSELIGGVEIDFVPSVDPTQGLVMGVRIQKYIGDIAKVGYYWSFSNNPKATYVWGSLRFLGGFLRAVRYSDGSKAVGVRFSGGFGSPY